jgi:hypothetical protein
MNLGFKERFKDLILSGEKIHTIREDSTDRWQYGMKIHFATGIRTKNYNCFKEGECINTQKIEFKWKQHNKGLVSESWGVQVFIDGRNVTNEGDVIDELAKNDGFNDRKEFFEWEAWNKKNFKGKIINWTNKLY